MANNLRDVRYFTIKILDKNALNPIIYIRKNFNNDDNSTVNYTFQFRLVKLQHEDTNGNIIDNETYDILNKTNSSNTEGIGQWQDLTWIQDGNDSSWYYTKFDSWDSSNNWERGSKLQDYFIQLKGSSNSNSIFNFYDSNEKFCHHQFCCNVKVKIFGELNSLCNWGDMSNYKFANFFYASLIKDASQLKLPDSVKQGCYNAMFAGCTALDSTPKFSGEIAAWCYKQMFEGCTSLTSVSDLPATTLADYCYCAMFKGCTKLTNPPNILATGLANYCCQEMFSDCTSLKSAPNLPATELKYGCYWNMFTGCTSLVVVPLLPNFIKLAPQCCQEMFRGCRNLVKIPTTLKATNMTYNNDGFAYNCFAYMFAGCKKITKAPLLPVTTLANGCYRGMFEGCDNLTATPSLPASAVYEGSYEGMFRNCINLTQISEIPATQIYWAGCQEMFKGCTSLKIAPELPATGLVSGCYQYMFEDCTSLKNIPTLPATTLAPSCYYGMFKGCTSLMTSPTLHANPNEIDCYSLMFYNCVNLNTLNIEFTNFYDNSNTINWVFNVSQTGTANINSDLLIYNYNDNCIPVKWKVNKYNGDYLTFETLGRLSKISLVTKGSPKTIKLEYKVNNNNWNTLKDKVISIKKGDKLQLRGANKHFSSNFTTDYYQFKTLGDNVKVYGNLMRLVGDQYNEKTNTWEIETENQFNRLFEHTNVENIDLLKLPATKLHRECYARMFANCKELFTIPKDLLSAANDKLEKGCYKEMFDGCTNLIGCSNTNENNLIDLPAKKLANNCYQAMFRGCENLDVLPVLTAKALEKDCYREMFYNCYKINSIEVKFDNWSNQHATDLWLSNTKNCTIFIKNNVLAEEYDQNHIPENSYIVKKED